MKEPYSEKQIEVANMLTSIDTPQAVVDEIMNMIIDNKELTFMPPLNNESVDAIKLKLLDETDWRKKAILAARIVSKGLE